MVPPARRGAQGRRVVNFMVDVAANNPTLHACERLPSTARFGTRSPHTRARLTLID